MFVLDTSDIQLTKDYSRKGREPWYKERGNKYTYSFDPTNNPDTDC